MFFSFCALQLESYKGEIMLTTMQHHQNAVKALVEGINRVNIENETCADQENMENIFKVTYSTFVFSKIPSIEPNIHRQVHDLPQLWEKVDQLIDRDDFFRLFASHCKELDLPFMELNLTSAFVKAQMEWAQDIMLQTADYILKWNEDEIITSQVAFWKDGQIRVDTMKCRQYEEWLLHNDV